MTNGLGVDGQYNNSDPTVESIDLKHLWRFDFNCWLVIHSAVSCTH